jgi:hypothetical protein
MSNSVNLVRQSDPLPCKRSGSDKRSMIWALRFVLGALFLARFRSDGRIFRAKYVLFRYGSHKAASYVLGARRAPPSLIGYAPSQRRSSSVWFAPRLEVASTAISPDTRISPLVCSQLCSFSTTELARRGRRARDGVEAAQRSDRCLRTT